MENYKSKNGRRFESNLSSPTSSGSAKLNINVSTRVLIKVTISSVTEDVFLVHGITDNRRDIVVDVNPSGAGLVDIPLRGDQGGGHEGGARRGGPGAVTLRHHGHVTGLGAGGDGGVGQRVHLADALRVGGSKRLLGARSFRSRVRDGTGVGRFVGAGDIEQLSPNLLQVVV